jgi:hypothetical protein
MQVEYIDNGAFSKQLGPIEIACELPAYLNALDPRSS